MGTATGARMEVRGGDYSREGERTALLLHAGRMARDDRRSQRCPGRHGGEIKAGHPVARAPRYRQPGEVRVVGLDTDSDGSRSRGVQGLRLFPVAGSLGCPVSNRPTRPPSLLFACPSTPHAHASFYKDAPLHTIYAGARHDTRRNSGLCTAYHGHVPRARRSAR